MKFVPLSEAEVESPTGFVFVPLEADIDDLSARNLAPRQAEDPAPVTDPMGSDLPGLIASRKGRSEPAPFGRRADDPRRLDAAKSPSAPAYRNRVEALDDAVNLVEEGADLRQVVDAFGSIGLREADIVAHGRARKSEMFASPDMGRREIDQYNKPQSMEPAQGTGRVTGWEPNAALEIANTASRGVTQANKSIDTMAFRAGLMDSDDMALKMGRRQRELDAAAPSGDVAAGLERLQQANETGSYVSVGAELLKPRNWKALAALITESMVATTPILAGTVAASAVGGPVAGATMAGLGSFSIEFASALGDTLEARKVDLSNPMAVAKALEDPGVLSAARERGIKRGIPIAVFDAASAGFAGRFLRTTLKAIDAGKLSGTAATKAMAVGSLKEGAAQAGAGAAGELVGQKMVGENKPLDVFIEALAEVPGGFVEAQSNIAYGRRSDPNRQIAAAIDEAVANAVPLGTREAAVDALRPDRGILGSARPASQDPIVAIQAAPTIEAAISTAARAIDQTIDQTQNAGAAAAVDNIARILGTEGVNVGSPAAVPGVAAPAGGSGAVDAAAGVGTGVGTAGVVRPAVDAGSVGSQASGGAVPLGAGQPGALSFAQRSAGPVQQITVTPAGTVTAVGDPQALMRLLKAAGVTSVIPSKDGITVGKSQATMARKILDDFVAAPPENPPVVGAKAQADGDVVLQNRNRSTPSSIAQMRSIAAAPDYGRLGFSRDFANGAPVISGGKIPDAQVGRSDVAVASDGRRIPVRYAVVEADSVLASNSADGLANPDYGRKDLDVPRAIAGNGRIAGLQAAHSSGQAGAYVGELTEDNLHGIDPDVIRGMRAPVLVRVMPKEFITADIGDVSNTTSNLDLSAVEAARNDAARISLDALQFSEDGTLTPEAVRQFVRAMPQAEQGSLVDTNGQPTRQAVDRLNAAVFSKAYGNDELIRLYAQAQDPEARLIMSALAQVAPAMARLEGAGDLDVRPVLTDAAKIAVNARRDGVSIKIAARQLDLDSDPGVSAFLDLFAANPRSVRPVVEALARVADFAYTEANKPDEDMFGPVERANRAQALNQIKDGDNEDSDQGRRLENSPGGRSAASVDRRQAADAAADAGASGRPGAISQAGRDEAADLKAEQPSRRYDGQDDLFNQQIDLFLDSQPDPSQAGAGVEKARRAAADALRLLGRQNSLLGQSLASGLAESQRTNLVGQVARSPEDVALLAQVYRDPRFETFRVIFTDDDGRVVSQVGLTSRLPGSTAVLIGKDLDSYLPRLFAAAQQTGAKSYYLLHNHPSGVATPSRADELVTQQFAAKSPSVKFQGHVVIDTNQYAVIGADGWSDVFRKDFGAAEPLAAGDWARTAITSPDQVMNMARRLQVTEDVTLIVLDWQLKVRNITAVPASVTAINRATTITAVRRALMSNMGSRAVAVSRDRGALDRLAASGVILDGIYVRPDGSVMSMANQGLVNGDRDLWPDRRKTRVTGDTSAVFSYLRQDSQTEANDIVQRRMRVAEDGGLFGDEGEGDLFAYGVQSEPEQPAPTPARATTEQSDGDNPSDGRRVRQGADEVRADVRAQPDAGPAGNGVRNPGAGSGVSDAAAGRGNENADSRLDQDGRRDPGRGRRGSEAGTGRRGAQDVAAAKIEDFGQKLEGARKDYAATLKDAEAVDIAAEPLSKSWPEPDYDKLLAGGADPYVVAFIHAARDEVPTKPQKGWKLKGWVDSVETLRGAAKGLLDGSITREQLTSRLTLRAFDNVRSNVGSRAELYELVGHAKSLKGVTFAEHHYSLYKGQENVRKWVVEQKAKATVFGNWPRELAVADTKAEMLEQFKAKMAAESLDGDKAKAAKGQFIIYRKRNQEGAFIGKKIGREYIDLKKLPDVAAARAYLESNTADLLAALERYKDTPFERNAENRPRVGDDHRNGAAVTPEVFADTFGFRGVQFGNYVEQDRRQSDLNQTFDALMDMAAVLGVPPRALSLNGRLGLAFGARGKGGRNAPAAHYEPDTVVINLTKGNGPGSLGHEWWHAVDNYFGKEFGEGGFATDGARVDRLRAEMQAAFKAVRNATQVPTLRKRAAELDKRRTKPYWNTPLELSARAFESYLIAKLNDQSAANDYLANVVDEKVWNLSEEARATFFGGEAVETYPYPGQAELPAVRAAFDEFFKVVETREDDAGNVAMFSRAQFRRGDTVGHELRVTEIQKAVSRLSADWLRRPDIYVIDSMDDAPGPIREEWLQQNSLGAAGSIEGFHYRGQVYLVADALVDEADVRRVLFHEALGHFGLQNVFGNGLNPILAQLATMRPQLIRAKAKQYGLDLSIESDRLIAAEEVLAELAQTRPELGWVQRAISAIRRWLRAHGVSLGLSDNDIIADYILPARGWVERGRAAAPSLMRGPAMAARSNAGRDPFYSALSAEVDKIGAKAMPAAGWASALTGLVNKGAVKADEVEWSGIREWLDMQQGKVSKEAVLAYLDQNGVQVQEVVLGGRDPEVITSDKALDRLRNNLPVGWRRGGQVVQMHSPDSIVDDNSYYRELVDSGEAEWIDTGTNVGGEVTNTKYGNYTLPGGTAYREVLLTLPGDSYDGFNKKMLAKYGAPWWPKATEAERAELERLRVKNNTQDYRSSHWDTPNVLAHIRLNDRTDADGKRVLFVEELQSDWQQQARKNGINRPPTAIQRAEMDAIQAKISAGNATIEDRRRYTELAGRSDGVPAAPFIDATDKWLTLALKRVMVMAAQEGYDKVAFVNGEQSAGRYSLDQHVDRLSWKSTRTDGAARNVQLDIPDNNPLRLRVDGDGSVLAANGPGFIRYEGKRLDEIIGKDLADKVLKEPNGELSGDGLKVEAKGMRSFYDKIVPAAVNKLLGKVGGGKLETVQIASGDRIADDEFGEADTRIEELRRNGEVSYETSDGRQFDTYADAVEHEQGISANNIELKPQPGFTITPAMAETLARGMPMFSRQGDQTETPAFRATANPTQAGTPAALTPQTSPWRDETGRLQFLPGAWLYEKFGPEVGGAVMGGATGAAAGPVGAVVGAVAGAASARLMLNRLELKAASPALRRALREMKIQVAKAQETAAAVATEAMKLTEAERGMVSDLIEQEMAAGTVPPQHAVRLAAMINATMGAQTDELVRLGMLSSESAEMWRGKYLPRFYESKLRNSETMGAWADALRQLTGRPKTMAGIKGKHLRGRGMYETIPEAELPQWEQMGWEVRDPDYQPGLTEDGTVQVWRDFTRQERDSMGEIRDAGFRFVMGYMQTQRDIALGRMFEALAADPAMSSRRETEEFSVMVPDSTVPGTGAKRYGKLAGRWVSKDTLSHLSAIEEAQSEVWRMYRKALATWKEGKTSMNPVSHVNNVVSNLTMAHLAGVSYLRADKYLGAARDFATNAPGIQEAKDAGLFLGTMSDAELMQVLPEDLKALVRKQDSTATKVGRSAFNVMTFFLRRPMGWAYQAEDTFFRYLIYKDARERGLEPADAVDYAQKYIFTYDDLPKGARMIRDFGIPFFSYTFKAVPALLHTAMTHPLRMAMPAALLWAANAAAYAIAFGGDDDDSWEESLKKYLTDGDFRNKVRQKEKLEREHLPPWMKGTTALLTPKTVRLGMDEVTKLPVFIDVSRIIPGGDLFDVSPNAGGIPLPQPVTPSHPLFTTAVAMLGNKDLFFGKELVDENDTRGEATLKRMDWMWKQMTPAIALGNYHFERGMNALAQATGEEIRWMPEAIAPDAVVTGIGRDGLPVQPRYAAMQTFGIKARPIDLEMAEDIGEGQKNKMLRKIDAEIRRLQRLNMKGAVADSVMNRKRDQADIKRERIRDGLTVDGEEKP